MTLNKTDVLTIGGGPAGSTLVAMMKKRGRDVTLLEKDHHPRFHIGEPLLPMNMPLLERHGATDQVKAIGVPKLVLDEQSVLRVCLRELMVEIDGIRVQ